MAIRTEPSIRRGVQTSRVYRIRGLKPLFYPHPQLSPENCVTIKNINITLEDVVESRKGYAYYNSNQITESSVAQVVNGLAHANFIGASEVNVEVAGTKIFSDDGSTRSDITGGLTITAGENNRNKFVFYDDKLIATNGTNPTWYWSGSGNAAALTGMQWSKCEDLVVHRNMLVALNTTESGTAHPTRMRWNDVDTDTFTGVDITSWPTRHVFDLYEDGAAIIGGTDNFGHLLVFKKDGMYPCRLEWGSGFVEMTLDERNVRKGFNPIAKHSIVSRPEFTWVICQDGPYIVRPDFSVEFVGNDFRKFWSDLPANRIQYCVSWIRERDHQVRTLISTSDNASGPGHDQVMVWNWRTNDFWIDEYASSMNIATQFFVSGAPFDMLGSTDGYVYKGNSGLTDNGSDIDWEVTMAPNDIELPGRTKTVLNFRTIVKSSATLKSLNLNVTLDQGILPPRSASLSIGSTLYYNSGLSYNLGNLWPGGTTERSSSFINRTLENLAPKWTGDTEIGIVGYQVDFQQEE